VLGASVIVWGTALYIVGPEPSLAQFKPFGVTSSVVTVLAVGFIKVFWKWKLLRGWIVKRPNLTGTWKAELVSSYKKNGIPVIKIGYMVISQDLILLRLRLYTDQGHSYSLSQNIEEQENGVFRLASAYLNVPDTSAQETEDSRIHHGAVLLSNIGYESETIQGVYWTERNTKGSIVLSDKKKKLVLSYKDGERLFSDSGSPEQTQS
jgi:hypothetical protein